MSTDVTHEKGSETYGRFVTKIESEEAFVEYRLTGNVMDMYYTYTPPHLRGKGLAAKVVKDALEFAKEKNYKVIPSCYYVRVFIERYDEYHSLLNRRKGNS